MAKYQKKIVLYAYMEMNLGDDLFVDYICRRYRNVHFYLAVSRTFYKQYLKSFNHENLTLISWNLFFKYFFGGLRRFNIEIFNRFMESICDGAVRIGGSLFIQRKRWRVFPCCYTKKPFYLLGANFGPYFDDTFVNTYRKEFLKYSDICFRDYYSYSLFSDLPCTRYESDILFSYPFEGIFDKHKYPKATKKCILISVMSFEEPRQNLLEYANDYYTKIAQIILEAVKKEYKIILMSFCKYEKDEKAINRVLELIKDDDILNNVDLYSYMGNLEEVVNVLNSSDYIIATRFHAMILGWRFGKIVYPIIYNQKMKNVISDLRFNDPFITVSDIQKLLPCDVLNYFENGKAFDISNAILSSKKQFEKLDDFLKFK